MNLGRARAVAWKDLTDLRKNRGLLASMLVLPLVLVAVPTFVVYAYATDAHSDQLKELARQLSPDSPPEVPPAHILVEKAVADWFGLFLIMPLFVPILISSAAVAGEKERRTLEPLLASPATAVEIVAGKSLAALAPAVAITALAFALFCVGVDLAAWPLYGRLLLPNTMWLFGVFVVAPLFAFLGNGVAILVSARVGDSRLAQQLSGLISLPLLGLVGAQIAGVLRAGTHLYAWVALVVLALDVLLLRAAIRLFDRERLLSRWG
jgi:ABC-2 type transport system permease protein